MTFCLRQLSQLEIDNTHIYTTLIVCDMHTQQLVHAENKIFQWPRQLIVTEKKEFRSIYTQKFFFCQ